MTLPQYQTFDVQQSEYVAHIRINRPEKANALSLQAMEELTQVMEWASHTPDVRVVVLSGNGSCFSAGIDLQDLGGLMMQSYDCEGRRREDLRTIILKLQQSFNAIETCRKPVLAAIHGHCIGAGLDLSCACDMRYATQDVSFVIKEIDIGMVADLGTLQRLPKLIPDGVVRELAYTGRTMNAEEALALGFVNQVFESKDALDNTVLEKAQLIAKKSPISIRGTKEALLYARDHSVSDALDMMATWNAAMLLSEDLMEAYQAQLQKKEPQFKN